MKAIFLTRNGQKTIDSVYAAETKAKLAETLEFVEPLPGFISSSSESCVSQVHRRVIRRYFHGIGFPHLNLCLYEYYTRSQRRFVKKTICATACPFPA